MESTESVISRPEHGMAQLERRMNPILQTLDDARNRLIETANEGDHDGRTTPKLPPIAFEIARVTKDLVHHLDDRDGGEDEDDEDFR